MRKIVEDIVLGLLALSAIAVAGVVIKRELFRPEKSGEFRERTLSVEDWKLVSATRHVAEPAKSPVRIIEFADFQCPACRHFALVVRPALIKEFGGRVAFGYRHYPLSYHPLAHAAARAAECAGVQGKFWSMHDVLFAKQDSLASRSMLAYARDAEVPDVAAFGVCLKGAASDALVDDDLVVAQKLQLPGTPSLVVNGKLLSQSDSATVFRAVRDVLNRTER